VLSASSDFFKNALIKANRTNPLIFLSGFDSKVLSAVLDYIYNGEVNLFQEEIDVFLDSAQKLRIHGLTQTLKEENKESTFIEQEVQRSIFEEVSYQKKEEVNSSLLRESTTTLLQQETTIATTDGSNVTQTNNYDELITKCELGWKCNYCGKITTTKTNMKLHVEIHIEGLSFPCKSCSMSFRSRNHLNVHKNRAHK